MEKAIIGAVVGYLKKRKIMVEILNFLTQPIDRFFLSTLVINNCKKIGIKNILDLLEKRNTRSFNLVFGQKTRKEVDDFLRRNGFPPEELDRDSLNKYTTSQLARRKIFLN